MQNDLIIMTFYNEAEAHKVISSLRDMRKSQILGLDQVSIVTKDSSGKVWLHHKYEISPRKQGNSDPILRFFAALIFNTFPAEIVQNLVDVGLDETFIHSIAHKMGKHSSALLFYIDHDDIEDKDELLKALSLFWGDIHQTTISDKVESAILEVFEKEKIINHDGDSLGKQ